MNKIVIDFFNTTQIIKCEFGHEYPFTEINEFKRYNMHCPNCINRGIITTLKVELKYEAIKQEFDAYNEKMAITFGQYLILDLLIQSQNALSILRISQSVDSAQLQVEKNIAILINRSLANLDEAASKHNKKEYYQITAKGVQLINTINDMIKSIKSQKGL